MQYPFHPRNNSLFPARFSCALRDLWRSGSGVCHPLTVGPHLHTVISARQTTLKKEQPSGSQSAAGTPVPCSCRFSVGWFAPCYFFELFFAGESVTIKPVSDRLPLT